MSRQVPLGLIVDNFPVYDADGHTRRTGETVFTASLWKDGTASAIPVTIVEIGSTGEYLASFTPDDLGFWVLDILVDYNKDIFSESYDVVAEATSEALFNAAYDDTTTTLYMELWLDRGGESVVAADLVSCQADVYNQDGTLLVSSSSSSPRTNGRFSLSEVVSLTDARPYNVSVSVTDNQGSVTTYHAFTTVEG